jgi:hypothetical protein
VIEKLFVRIYKRQQTQKQIDICKLRSISNEEKESREETKMTQIIFSLRQKHSLKYALGNGTQGQRQEANSESMAVDDSRKKQP